MMMKYVVKLSNADTFVTFGQLGRAPRTKS